MTLSPDEQKLAFVINQEHGSEVWILTTENQKEKIIYRTSNQNEINSLEWDPASEKILIAILNLKKEKKYLVFDTEKPQKIDIYDELNDFYPQNRRKKFSC